MWRRLAAGGLLAVVGGMVLTPVPASASDTPPYQDPNASGSITLCDQALKPITSGSITDRPTVWRAVGSQRPPAPYDGPDRKASLFVAQPRQGVDPAQWSLFPVTAASRYTNADHPMAQSTVIDIPFKPGLDGYPPLWHGWMQLRLIYSYPNNPTLTAPYAAANMRISNGTWRVVDAGSSPCDAGDAVSPEIALPYYSKSAKAVLRQQARQSPSADPSPGGTPSLTPSAQGGPGDQSSTPVAGGSSGMASDGGGSSFVPWLLGIVVLGLAVLGIVYAMRTGREPGRHA